MCSSQQTTFPQHLIASPTGSRGAIWTAMQAFHLTWFFILFITRYNDSSRGNALAYIKVLVVTIS